MLKRLLLVAALLTASPAIAQIPTTIPGQQLSSTYLNSIVTALNAVVAQAATTLGLVTSATQSVPTLAALKALVPSSTTVVHRLGYAVAGDAGSAIYLWSATACTLNAGAGDNGVQVAPATGTGCWIAQVNTAYPPITLWGADPTGTIDSGPAVATACANSAGRNMYAPAGVYWINTPVTIALLCNLTGDGVLEGGPVGAIGGTWFKITSQSLAPFTFTTGAAGSHWSRFGVSEPNQIMPPTTGTYVPDSYQYVFTANNVYGEVNFSDITLFPVYNGFNIQGGRFAATHIHGQCLSNCFYFDNDEDTAYLDDIHIWPYWASTNPLYVWQEANADGIIAGRLDTPAWGRLFFLGMRSGVHIIESPLITPGATYSLGTTTGASIQSLDCDACKYALWVSGNNADLRIGTQFSAGEFGLSQIPGSTMVYVDGTYSTINLGNANFGNFACAAITVPAGVGGNIITAGILNLGNVNQLSCTPSAIFLGQGTVSANSFLTGTAPILLSYAGSITMFNTGTNAVIDAPVTLPWTPALMGDTTSGSVPSGSTFAGSYTVHGTHVSANFSIVINGSLGSGYAGHMYLGGLPYAANSQALGGGACAITYTSGVTYPSGTSSIGGVIAVSSANMFFFGSGSGVAPVLLPTSEFGANSGVVGTCNYER